MIIVSIYTYCKDINSIQSKGFWTLYFLGHPKATWKTYIDILSFSTKIFLPISDRKRDTSKWSATNLIYWLISSEFIPINAQGRASQTNWVSISTASCTISWTFCQCSWFRNVLQKWSEERKITRQFHMTNKNPLPPARNNFHFMLLIYLLFFSFWGKEGNGREFTGRQGLERKDQGGGGYSIKMKITCIEGKQSHNGVPRLSK